MNEEVKSDCRWCGSELNQGFKVCKTCHKNQSRLHSIFGEGSNLIGVIAAIITFGQLMIAIQQNNSAIDAAKIAEDAQISTQEAVQKFDKLESKFKQIELDSNQVASELRQAILKIKALEPDIIENKRVDNATKDLNKVRSEYSALKAKLVAVPKTIEISEPQVRMEKQCTNILGLKAICTNVPQTIIVEKSIANPEYRSIQKQLEQKQIEIKAMEEILQSTIER